MPSLLLGIDIGTTATKAVLLDPDAGVIAETTRASTLHAGRPGVAEADTAQWRQNIAGVVADLGPLARDIGAVATTGMVPAVLPLDPGGGPLRPAILQNDARAVTEIDEIAALTADLDLLQLTGSALTQQSVAPTALWLSRNESTLWRETASIVGSYDWVAMWLGAEPHVERNWAIESGLFTLDGEPLDRLFVAGALASDAVPPIRSSGEIVGSVTGAASAATGLTAGTPIVVGGADHVLAAASSGLAKPGDWLVKIGGGGDILVVTDGMVLDQRLYLDVHPAPGLWLPNGCMATSGSLVRWFSTLVGEPDLSRLDAEADAATPGAVLCLPYFLGEKSPMHDPDLRGAFLGLGLDDTRGAMFRSVLEAVAFGFRQHRDIVAERAALAPTARISDGGSRSTLWTGIVADVLDTPLTPVIGTTGAALGAAIAAGIGIGTIPDWSAAERYITLGPIVVPDPGRVAHYDGVYTEWLAAAAAVAPISHTLARRSRT